MVLEASTTHSLYYEDFRNCTVELYVRYMQYRNTKLKTKLFSGNHHNADLFTSQNAEICRRLILHNEKIIKTV